MKLTFIRADHEVTGSCTLLEIGGHYGLIDCGMQQGRDQFENIDIPVPAAQIEFVLVTHAHMDHTGHLPLLYKQGFRGTVYATEATCDLCGIMLRDAAHIQMSEAEWRGRKAARAGRAAPEPLYTLEDAEGVLTLLRPCSYGQRVHRDVAHRGRCGKEDRLFRRHRQRGSAAPARPADRLGRGLRAHRVDLWRPQPR